MDNPKRDPETCFTPERTMISLRSIYQEACPFVKPFFFSGLMDFHRLFCQPSGQALRELIKHFAHFAGSPRQQHAELGLPNSNEDPAKAW
jgi:hypothetical protein